MAVSFDLPQDLVVRCRAQSRVAATEAHTDRPNARRSRRGSCVPRVCCSHPIGSHLKVEVLHTGSVGQLQLCKMSHRTQSWPSHVSPFVHEQLLQLIPLLALVGVVPNIASAATTTNRDAASSTRRRGSVIATSSFQHLGIALAHMLCDRQRRDGGVWSPRILNSLVPISPLRRRRRLMGPRLAQAT